MRLREAKTTARRTAANHGHPLSRWKTMGRWYRAWCTECGHRSEIETADGAALVAVPLDRPCPGWQT